MINGNIRSAIVAGLALFAVLLGGQTVYAQAVSTVLTQKAPEAAEITTIADRRGYVRVIVQFAPPLGLNQIRPDPTTLAPIKQQIAATQNAIIGTHFGNAANPAPGQGFTRGVRRFDITPAFAVNVTRAELEALAADPRVVRIQYDRAVPHTLIQSVPLIGMSVAYGLGATGQGQAVAILDTGVQSNHEFLTGKVVSEACFSNAGGFGGNLTLCPNGQSSQTGAGAANSETAQCINGSTELCVHGTHVAGIAAGKNTSQGGGEPANGVAKEAQIVAVQIFTRFNSTADCGAGNAPCVLSYISDQIDALNWVLQNAINLPAGVKTASINMSLGGGLFTSPCDDDATKTPIDSLKAAGVATAIAAGNNGSVNAVSSPGCISTAITVGSSTKSDQISSFSNMAPMVDLMAPGSSILSSVAVVPHSTTTYQFFDGTSMATPHVAGAFAAIRTVCPTKTVDEIEAALKSTGTPITDNRSGGTQTKPRIRVDSAVAALGCNALAVSPASDMDSSGFQGGPFSPSSFNYTLSASAGSVDFSISGVPSWLSASSTSGTVTSAGTTVTFTVNASANSLSTAVYSATITFTNTTNGQGTQSRTATLTVNSASPALQVSPATNIASNGNQGGPFSPSSFNYQLSATIGSLNYSITGTPSWLNVSSTSGTVTTSPTTVTFTVNANANSLAPGVYGATITFTNTTNDQGTTFRESTL
ncbi:MAG TPA: S8 family serine peptidase, partial [Xanthobacteraceae bacterium]|nr:S8 family serine peptidase [Xanthobacteraceae bacterium]